MKTVYYYKDCRLDSATHAKREREREREMGEGAGKGGDFIQIWIFV